MLLNSTNIVYVSPKQVWAAEKLLDTIWPSKIERFAEFCDLDRLGMTQQHTTADTLTSYTI